MIIIIIIYYYYYYYFIIIIIIFIASGAHNLREQMTKSHVMSTIIYLFIYLF